MTPDPIVSPGLRAADTHRFLLNASRRTFAALSLGAALAAQADTGRSFDIYGFAQVDMIGDSKRVAPDWEDAFRPSRIAAPEGIYGTNGQSDLSVKQSRLGVKGTLPTSDNAPPVSFKLEIDFFGTGANAGQTTVRLRYAYGEWSQILGGQTTSLFMDLDVFPNVIDYWGPPGMVFNRDPQLRWTPLDDGHQRFAVALEKPSNDIDPGNYRSFEAWQNAETANNEQFPDFTAQYRYTAPWGHAQIAGLVRDVGYQYRITPDEPWKKGSQTGWGVNLDAVLKTIGDDQLILQVVHGDGIATYMNDGGMDLAPEASYPPVQTPAGVVPRLSAEAVPLTGVVAYYDHWWSKKYSTSFGYSFTEVDNTNFQTPDTFHKGQYASANLLFYPVNRVMFGAEVMWGERTNNNGVAGIDWRLQVSAKYSFDAKIL